MLKRTLQSPLCLPSLWTSPHNKGFNSRIYRLLYLCVIVLCVQDSRNKCDCQSPLWKHLGGKTQYLLSLAHTCYFSHRISAFYKARLCCGPRTDMSKSQLNDSQQPEQLWFHLKLAPLLFVLVWYVTFLTFGPSVYITFSKYRPYILPIQNLAAKDPGSQKEGDTHQLPSVVKADLTPSVHENCCTLLGRLF